ncbi:osmotically activated L-carnitine/choline ABC transporter [Gracilibacillus boraciitolerans JCM 21714]|uniref:Osmotically activated L-carnitine/choline ABC transporter n=2 Tax=Gracilibacillus boraciitolerans TaxID=307521 RepID=W4VP05_9BACI|nr:osmotically activated L-carnitine/choline ABC transporter [Gracilibacillus boraciitolerans JCM 21714]
MGKLKNSIILLTLLTLILTACGDDQITVGTQTYTETKILGYMYEALVEEQTDVEVVVKTDFSASPVVIEAMNGDDVQLTTLYTGEIFNGHFSIEDTNDRESVLQQAKEGFKETYNFNGTIRSVLKTHMLLQLDRKLRRNII